MILAMHPGLGLPRRALGTPTALAFCQGPFLAPSCGKEVGRASSTVPVLPGLGSGPRQATEWFVSVGMAWGWQSSCSSPVAPSGSEVLGRGFPRGRAPLDCGGVLRPLQCSLWAHDESCAWDGVVALAALRSG